MYLKINMADANEALQSMVDAANVISSQGRALGKAAEQFKRALTPLPENDAQEQKNLVLQEAVQKSLQESARRAGGKKEVLPRLADTASDGKP